MAGPILIVDDDPVQRRLLEAAVTKFGHEAIVVDGGEAALAVLDGPRGRDVSAVILDLMMPGLDGIGVMAAMRERDIALPVIVQTAQGGIDTVVAAMRAGAFDFVVKPASPDRLQAAISSALKVEAVGEAVRRARKPSGGTLTFKDLVTRSETMERVIRLGQKAAASSIPILIEGESGVGKEMVARAIQGSGERRSKPFVTVNCGAIPENLVESILFGHEKGAFTGATEKHTGKFVEAHSGTLFLDEIGDLPLDVQVKLLRAVQDGEVDPVGARATVKVDIRLISATHRNLLQQVKEGKFREDLFYRLNVFPIFVPPLRDRRDDIPHLVSHFMARMTASGGRGIGAISEEALRMLQAYDWPGNIRQLENAVFRATVLCDGDVLTAADFPQIRAQVEGIELSPEIAGAPEAPAATAPSVPAPVAAQSPAAAAAPAGGEKQFGILRALDERGNVRALAEIELDLIKLAIERYNGQMSEVARRLGIGRSTLYRKLKEYGIDPDQQRSDRLAS
ncbi:sigma-54-dependent Fis family transcriptional regulator [Mesorhizobium sp. L-8-10]|uniref:sigma-54-dependent transcriptional regulator n=1 Tax=unclassified Mesorhizobium TaxID=325217 RepID=UPI0019261D03|nr:MULTISPECIES: sigma-54 dependent transcriptional regulator [unclassified Mesorhizobium]BCH23081.1 sigma-54-dependent Fis family transcriptional regulator [Mesorhizobium sp. L-8-3]BCH30894.1 sigma-54-dependent Fis family transcriptional regulator [Mesorhizobium sp. L-8-10]